MSKLRKSDLEDAVMAALKTLGGEASVLDVAKQIWKDRETDLQDSGDLFYTWQYDMRWAAQNLRKKKKATLGGSKGNNTWRLI